MFPTGSIIPYITAGDPDIHSTLIFLRVLDEYAGAIEIGLPFSDPVADGATIQHSHHRALSSGFKLESVFHVARKFRRDSDTPLVLMSYYNPIYRFDPEKFMEKAHENGVDALLVVDLPVTHAQGLLETAKEFSLKTVFLASPNTPNERLAAIDKASTGFVYLISTYGTTGMRDKISSHAFNLLQRANRICRKKIAVGFGVSRREHVEYLIKMGADGVVVGSALVALIEKLGKSAEDALRKKMRELSGL